MSLSKVALLLGEFLVSKSTQRSGTRITCSEVVDLCERIYTENPDLPVVGARVLGLFLCSVWL